MPSAHPERRFPALLLAFFLSAQWAFAYEVPLSDQSIREAYFLGQRQDEKRTAFLAAYQQRLPLPSKGPHVAEIEVLTPYAQVVDISRQKLSYSAQQAAQDYRERGDTIYVRVLISFTPTYSVLQANQSAQHAARGKSSGFRPEDFWKDFQFYLIQRDRTLKWREAWGQPEFSVAGADSDSYLIGARVWLTFDAAFVKSADATVEVDTPDGQQVTATFDLDKLR